MVKQLKEVLQTIIRVIKDLMELREELRMPLEKYISWVPYVFFLQVEVRELPEKQEEMQA